ncbi:SAVMC3_10250 family protein [Streptomyces filamentosus]
MRDVIYLSAGKLQQFLPEPRRAPRTAGVRLSTPFGFGVDVDAQEADGEQGRMKHLRQVQKHLEETALWYEDPGLRPGTWVQFEAPMRCVTLRGAYRDLLLFVDSGTVSGTASGTGEDAGCRLLLHGSARHLLGWTPQLAEGPALSEMVGGDSVGTVFLTRAGQVVEALSSGPRADEAPVSPLPPRPERHGHPRPAARPRRRARGHRHHRPDVRVRPRHGPALRPGHGAPLPRGEPAHGGVRRGDPLTGAPDEEETRADPVRVTAPGAPW